MLMHQKTMFDRYDCIVILSLENFENASKSSFCITVIRAGEGISEPLSDILYNMLSDELFKHPATQIESLVLSCR